MRACDIARTKPRALRTAALGRAVSARSRSASLAVVIAQLPRPRASSVVFNPAWVMQSAARSSNSSCGATGTTIVFDGIGPSSSRLAFLPTENTTWNSDSRPTAPRIAHHRVGEFLEARDLTAAGLSGVIRKVLDDPSYSDRARSLRDAIAAADGLNTACDLIERAFGVRA